MNDEWVYGISDETDVPENTPEVILVDMEKASPELKEQVFNLMLANYLGDICPYCLKEFATLDDLHSAVWNGYTNYGGIAHKACFERAHPGAICQPKG